MLGLPPSPALLFLKPFQRQPLVSRFGDHLDPKPRLRASRRKSADALRAGWLAYCHSRIHASCLATDARERKTIVKCLRF